jgi:Domain of unknown function (DUF4157)
VTAPVTRMPHPARVESEHAVHEPQRPAPTVERARDLLARAPRSAGAALLTAPRWSEPEPVPFTEPDGMDEQRADRVAEQLDLDDHPDPPPPPAPTDPPDSPPASARPPGLTPEMRDVLSGAGSPLDPAIRRLAEGRLGVGLGNVRVHEGAGAQRSARQLGASAYTVGTDIVLGRQFSPNTRGARQLLSHEIGHVVAPPSAGRIARQPAPAPPAPPAGAAVSMDGLPAGVAAIDTHDDPAWVITRTPALRKKILSITWDDPQDQATLPKSLLDPEQTIIRADNATLRLSRSGAVEDVEEKDWSDWLANAKPWLRLVERASGANWVLAERGKTFMLVPFRNVDKLPDIPAGTTQLWALLPGSSFSPQLLASLQRRGSGQAGTADEAPDWAKDAIMAARRRRAAQPVPGDADDDNQSDDKPLQGKPTLQVHVAPNGTPQVRITVDRATTTIDLVEGQGAGQLDKRIDTAIDQLQQSRDPTKVVGVRNARPDGGFVQEGAGQVGSGAAATKQAHEAVLAATPGERSVAHPGDAGVANAPRYPASITMAGVDPDHAPVSVPGATNHLTMTLDFAAWSYGVADEVFNRLQPVAYYWEIINVSDLSPAGQEQLQEKAEDDPTAANGRSKEAGVLGGAKAHLVREMNAVAADQHRDIQMMHDQNWSWDSRAAYLSVIGVSNVVRVVGTIIESYAELLFAPWEERALSFPGEGDFLVRCVATPQASDKAKADPEHHVIRASSVAVLPVRVASLNRRAAEVAEREQQQLSKSLDDLRDAKATGSPTEIAAAQADFDAKLAARSLGGRDAFTAHIAFLKAQIGVTSRLVVHQAARIDPRLLPEDELRTLVWLTAEQMEPATYLRDLRAELKSLTGSEKTDATMSSGETWVENQFSSFTTFGQHKDFRPRAGLASEENGQVIPLRLMLGYTPLQRGGLARWTLVDITAASTRYWYDGSSPLPGPAGHAAAIRDAFQHFANKCDYGRGALAVQLPSELTDAVDGLSSDLNMAVYPGPGSRFVQRLVDIGNAAGVVALAASGPVAAAAGVIGGVAGGILSGTSLAKRSRTGHFWEVGTLFDVLNVADALAAVGGLGTSVLRFKQEATPRFIRNVERVDGVLAVWTKFSNIVRVTTLPIQLEAELDQITQQHGLTPGQASGLRALAILRFLNSGAQLVHTPRGAEHEPAPHEQAAPRPGDLARERLAAAEHIGVEPHDDEAHQRTAVGTARGGLGGGTPPPAEPVRGAARREIALQLLQARHGRLLPGPEPTPGAARRPGDYGTTSSGAEAVQLYDAAVRTAHGSEVGLFFNPNDGTFRIRIGTPHQVGPPAGDGWQGLVHLHQNPENIITRRLPAPADVEQSAIASMRTGSHVEYVQSTRPDGTLGLTKITVTAQPRRIIVEMLAEPGEPGRRIDVRSLADYVREYTRDTVRMDPTSAEYEWVMRDLREYDRNRGSDWDTLPMGGPRTAAGTAKSTRRKQPDQPQDRDEPKEPGKRTEPDQAAGQKPPARVPIEEAMAQLKELAEDNVAVLEQRLQANRTRRDRIQDRIKQINDQLTAQGVGLVRLGEERFRAKLPAEQRRLAQERADIIDESKGLQDEANWLGPQLALWRKAASSDLIRARYLQLRPRTPDDTARVRARGAGRDILGVVGTDANPLEPDHVVPVLEIVAMKDFVLLSDEAALKILNWEGNQAPLNKSRNRQKRDWSWEDYRQWGPDIDPKVRAEWIGKEQTIRGQLRNRIKTAYAAQRARGEVAIPSTGQR